MEKSMLIRMLKIVFFIVQSRRETPMSIQQWFLTTKRQSCVKEKRPLKTIKIIKLELWTPNISYAGLHMKTCALVLSSEPNSCHLITFRKSLNHISPGSEHLYSLSSLGTPTDHLVRKYSLVQNSGHTLNENAYEYYFCLRYCIYFNYFSCFPLQISSQAHKYSFTMAAFHDDTSLQSGMVGVSYLSHYTTWICETDCINTTSTKITTHFWANSVRMCLLLSQVHTSGRTLSYRSHMQWNSPRIP
jgi:hypothetical protein